LRFERSVRSRSRGLGARRSAAQPIAGLGSSDLRPAPLRRPSRDEFPRRSRGQSTRSNRSPPPGNRQSRLVVLHRGPDGCVTAPRSRARSARKPSALEDTKPSFGSRNSARVSPGLLKGAVARPSYSTYASSTRAAGTSISPLLRSQQPPETTRSPGRELRSALESQLTLSIHPCYRDRDQQISLVCRATESSRET